MDQQNVEASRDVTKSFAFGLFPDNNDASDGVFMQAFATEENEENEENVQIVPFEIDRLYLAGYFGYNSL